MARDLRRAPTRSEQLLWQRLRARRLDGFKFRRQHPLGRFVLDFYCMERRLAIEVDGDIHDDPATVVRDADRAALIRDGHIQLLRFRAEDVEHNIGGVLEKIRQALM
jgi:very-short-patch-repair endonuclease